MPEFLIQLARRRVRPLPPPVGPTAAFSASPLSGDLPLEVGFTDESVDSPSRWAWDFGDSGTSDLRNPTHTYTEAGNYSPSLLVWNHFGESTLTRTDYITVTAPAVPSLVSAQVFCLDLGAGGCQVFFYNNVTDGPPCTVRWILKRGKTTYAAITATEQNTPHSANLIISNVADRGGAYYDFQWEYRLSGVPGPVQTIGTAVIYVPQVGEGTFNYES